MHPRFPTAPDRVREHERRGFRRMTDKAFTVGQRVAVEDGRGRIRTATVAEIRQFKVRTRVTLDDGSTWCGEGHPWSRSTWDTAILRPMSDEIIAHIVDQNRRYALNWMLEHWAELDDDAKAKVGDTAREIRRNHKPGDSSHG